MTEEQKKVREFHLMAGGVVNDAPTLSPETDELRFKLIDEELEELVLAMNERNLVEVADALGDLLYVVYGTAVTKGIDLEPIFNEIHRSNMTKTSGLRNPSGKILKGPEYEPPDLAPILMKQGWVP